MGSCVITQSRHTSTQFEGIHHLLLVYMYICTRLSIHYIPKRLSMHPLPYVQHSTITRIYRVIHSERRAEETSLQPCRRESNETALSYESVRRRTEIFRQKESGLSS
jgi:hypothetical protein